MIDPSRRKAVESLVPLLPIVTLILPIARPARGGGVGGDAPLWPEIRDLSWRQKSRRPGFGIRELRC
jgi:hypothetical protein